MEQLIIEILSCHPEGILESDICKTESRLLGVDSNDVRAMLRDMLRKNILVSIPRVFSPGEPVDDEILYALPKKGVVLLPPNENKSPK